LTFAWQGFQIEHPDDWAPALISGQREEGYARIASPEAVSYQIRWKQSKKNADLQRTLDEYLARLARDAKKLKTKFKSETERIDSNLEYRWSGAGNGKGLLLQRGGRTFFLEASSTSNRSVQSHFRDLEHSFQTNEGNYEPWSVFGLAVNLPTGFGVEKHVFQSGRTRIEWRDRSTRVVAERWGFGEQILARHTFEQWAMDSMAMPKAKIMEAEKGLELVKERPFLKIYGLATCDLDRNQLVTLKVTCRSAKGRPDWDWLI
jgi:hypothetical protein